MRSSKVIAVLVFVLGCGDKSPQDQCEDLVSLVCDRAVDCFPHAAVTHDSCFDQLGRTAGCESITLMSPTYNACVNRVMSLTCPMLFPNATNNQITAVLPVECSDVVMFPSASRTELTGGRERGVGARMSGERELPGD